MSQTEEDRIRKHYKSLRRSYHGWPYGQDNFSVGQWIWMPLARKWKRPISEIKRIVGRGSDT